MGIAVLRANPTRSINQAFAVLSAGGVIWLATLGQINPAKPNILFWIRLANAEAALLPWMFWMLKDTVCGASFGLGALRRSWLSGLISVGLIVLCFTDFFIPSTSTPTKMLVGPGRGLFNVVLGGEYLALLLLALRAMRGSDGIRKIELQFLLINGTGAGLGAILLNSLSVWLHIPELRRHESLLIVGFYVVTAHAVTSQKVFDARELMRSSLRWLQVVGALVVVIGAAFYFGELWFSRPVVILVTSVLIAVTAGYLFRSELPGEGLDRNSEASRRRLLATGQATRDWAQLQEDYTKILREWGHSEHVDIYIIADGFPSAHPISSPLLDLIEHELEKDSWTTPERLEREVGTEGKAELAAYIQANNIGVIVAGPRGPGLVPTFIMQGVRFDRRPFTYSQVQFLKDCVALIENDLSRMVLTQQARDTEQLATAGLLGASLAHEIRNPLVTIKSVVQLADERFEQPEFRRLLTKVMPGEIARIEVLVSGLMELGKPRVPELVSLRLNEVVESSLLLVRPRAKERDVTITQILDANPDELCADGSSLRQLILNLVMNSIDALSALNGERIVTVRTLALDNTLVLEIGDSGPGLPEEVRRTLFRPFTKSSKTSGMGLGLAICADIVRSHHGEIKLVEQAGRGALFRITLPICQPP